MPYIEPYLDDPFCKTHTYANIICKYLELQNMFFLYIQNSFSDL